MTSDSHTRYGSRVRRQGRSRWKWRNQASRFPRNAARSCPVSMARREILAQVAKDSRNYIFDLSLFLFEEDDKGRTPDRKSTRLNSSHVAISYAVFCLKKKI